MRSKGHHHGSKGGRLADFFRPAKEVRIAGTDRNLWRFDPETFYDGGISKVDGRWRHFSELEHGGLPSFNQVEYITFKEFVQRAETAADENNRCLLQQTSLLPAPGSAHW